jgi:hypothetical protein
LTAGTDFRDKRRAERVRRAVFGLDRDGLFEQIERLLLCVWHCHESKR